MSGVFAYASRSSRELPLAVAQRMGATLRHQPHLRVDVAAAGPMVALGRIGLGLINPTPRPARSGDGQVQLCLSGEFYHQSAARAKLGVTGDADLALATYLRDGPEGLTAIDGAFAMIVWDARADELLVVNDRYGLYPHYYAHTSGGFVLGPEIKSVVSAPGVPRRLDRTALAQYVRFQQLLGQRTWLEAVSLLPPASLARYRVTDDQLTITRYWDWDRIALQPSVSPDEAADECGRLLQRAVDAMSGPPLRRGVYLSGGLDSRTILGLLKDRGPVTTVTYGAPECRDVVYAAELARRAGSQHRWYPLTDGRWVLDHAKLHLALTEGMHSWMHAHGLSTLADARTMIDVNLSGWDGGTILGGYLDDYEPDRAYRHAPSEPDLVQRLYDAFCRSLTWPGLREAEAHTLFSGRDGSEMPRLAFESFRDELGRTRHYSADRRADYFYVQQHVLRSTVNQIVFSRAAFEVRCPFFDYDFLSFVYSLPEPIRATPALHRAVITRRLPHLARVPHERNDRLPHESRLLRYSHALLQRGKNRIHRHLLPVFPPRPRLYADYEQYLRTDLRAWAEDILFAPRTADRGLFDQTAVRALWARHQRGDELWTIGKIAPLITIELVVRALLDEPVATQTAGPVGVTRV